jgi:peptidoglycan/LPS O-acetylase OafA/YrhL
LFFSFLKENEIELGYFLSLLISFIVTVLAASISYELIEKNILKFKVKYALIKSGRV